MKTKPTPGHKFNGVRYMAQAKCECGWEGDTHLEQGARANAYGDWRAHVAGCNRGEPTRCSCHAGKFGHRCDACENDDHAACGRCNVASKAKGYT